MAQVLYRKWRSQTFDEVVGQEHVTQTLRNALRDGRTAHAYLFTGPRGTGKTSTARLLAKAVNCLDPDPGNRPDNTCNICLSISNGSLLDLIEIDAASNRGIDEIRDLRDRVHFSPSQARYKVYVIDEVHMLTPEAFNALLKTLEEPPPHVIFVLATTEPHKIPDTVLSRCQRFDFRRIPPYKVAGWLAHILEEEGRSAEPAALEMIARSTEGSMRDAISLTDQLLSYGDAVITEAQVRAVRGTISSVAIAALVDELVEDNASGGLATINQMVAEGIDLRQLAIQLVAHLRAVLLCQVNAQQARRVADRLVGRAARGGANAGNSVLARCHHPGIKAVQPGLIGHPHRLAAATHHGNGLAGCAAAGRFAGGGAGRFRAGPGGHPSDQGQQQRAGRRTTHSGICAGGRFRLASRRSVAAAARSIRARQPGRGGAAIQLDDAFADRGNNARAATARRAAHATQRGSQRR